MARFGQIPTTLFTKRLLKNVFDPQSFEHSVVLSSQRLNEMQANIREALSRLVLAMSGGMDFVVIEPEETATSIMEYCDAVFVSQSSFGATQHHSYRHGVQGSAFLPHPITNNEFTYAVGDAVHFGSRLPLVELRFTLSTPAGASWVNAWEYWNGAWTAMTGLSSPASRNWQSSSNMFFDQPEDWELASLDDIYSITYPEYDTPLYWVRARCTTLDTLPIFTEITLEEQFVDSLRVLEAETPDLTVRIAPGVAIVNKHAVYKPAFSTLDFTSDVPVSDRVKVSIYLDEDSNVARVVGPVSATPVAPKVPLGTMKLGEIEIRSTTTTILTSGTATATDAIINDSRVLWHTPVA